MIQRIKVKLPVLILCLFGLTLVMVSPVLALTCMPGGYYKETRKPCDPAKLGNPTPRNYKLRSKEQVPIGSIIKNKQKYGNDQQIQKLQAQIAELQGQRDGFKERLIIACEQALLARANVLSVTDSMWELHESAVMTCNPTTRICTSPSSGYVGPLYLLDGIAQCAGTSNNCPQGHANRRGERAVTSVTRQLGRIFGITKYRSTRLSDSLIQRGQRNVAENDPVQCTGPRGENDVPLFDRAGPGGQRVPY